MTLAESDLALDALVVEGFALDRDHAREILEARETSDQDHQTVSGGSAEVTEGSEDVADASEHPGCRDE